MKTFVFLLLLSFLLMEGCKKQNSPAEDADIQSPDESGDTAVLTDGNAHDNDASDTTDDMLNDNDIDLNDSINLDDDMNPPDDSSYVDDDNALTDNDQWDDAVIADDADDELTNDSDVENVSGSLWIEFQTGQPSGTAGGVRGRALYVWVEDEKGNYVDTIQQYHGRPMVACPTGLTYTCTGYRYYDDPCWDWRIATGETAPIQPDPVTVPDTAGTSLVVDGVTSASALPQPGNLPSSSGTVKSVNWDMLDKNGHPVAQGDYTVQIEITWERADGLGHTRPCETYPETFPCNFRYSAAISLKGSDTFSDITPNDWMLSSGTVYFDAE